MAHTIKTCGRYLGYGRHSRGTCFTCNGAGKVKVVKTKLVDVEQRLTRTLWTTGSNGGWMSQAAAESEAARYPGATVEYHISIVRKRVPV